MVEGERHGQAQPGPRGQPVPQDDGGERGEPEVGEGAAGLDPPRLVESEHPCRLVPYELGQRPVTGPGEQPVEPVPQFVVGGRVRAAGGCLEQPAEPGGPGGPRRPRVGAHHEGLAARRRPPGVEGVGRLPGGEHGEARR